jgi:hypothetical protein
MGDGVFRGVFISLLLIDHIEWSSFMGRFWFRLDHR